MQSQVIYYSTIFIAAILAGFSQKILLKSKNDKAKQYSNFFWFLSMSVFIVIFGLRKVGIGVDDNSYARIFQETATNGVIGQFLKTTMEPGYLILNYIVSIFTNDFQIMIFITTAIPIFLYYKALKYEFNNISMFWAIFLLGTLLILYFCGITRLFIASSIIAYGFKYILENKPIKYIIVVIIAMSFHYSAIFMIFLLYLIDRKKEKSTFKIIFLVSLIMPLVIYVITNYILPNMGNRYDHYTEISNGSFTWELFDKLPFVIIAIFFQKQIAKNNPNIKKYITVYAMATVISIYSMFIDIGRVQWYCMFSMCVILPSILEVLKKIKKQEYAVIYILLLITYSILYSNRILSTSTRESMLLYKNILF